VVAVGPAVAVEGTAGAAVLGWDWLMKASSLP